MQTLTDENIVAGKARELCQTILDQPRYREMRRSIETFLGNEEAKSQYQLLSEKGEYLQHKQQQGLPLKGEEITEFESLREKFLNNPVAKNFLEAQREVQKIQDSVAQYLSKTFELGRVPSEEDLDSGSCGHGCGCHH